MKMTNVEINAWVDTVGSMIYVKDVESIVTAISKTQQISICKTNKYGKHNNTVQIDRHDLYMDILKYSDIDAIDSFYIPGYQKQEIVADFMQNIPKCSHQNKYFNVLSANLKFWYCPSCKQEVNE